ncbi:putative GPI anchored endo-1,3(4)-beta-glucanase [Aspergillus chevalieri]|uniref:endo-1,3(4)-beta-glucanase n=1 Tax=Aspergillus chevalieri TaxID=182096 RepID=A0A7R7VR79_ASPCH|nr:uncharacterized protein ACHE_50534S [Aspergillus chevalieri]BCR89336.1 hypothetical protein ACHE_50534S [Aspergillus chevalieri]
MPSSWLLSVGTLVASSIFSPVVAGGSWPAKSYLLAENWQGDSFLDHIEFFTGADPTNGYVTYQNQSSAESSGLFKVTSSGSMYLGVDHTNTLDPNGAGRDSVRVESKMFYKQGLYIVDIAHMPGSVCGTWPAFWSVGPRWPQDGEIDIVEGVNKNEYNEIVLHTSGSCGISADNDMTGTVSSTECGEASGTIGCVVKGKNGTSGTPFNEQGGGVYALERTSEFIKIWYFPRGSIPKSIANGTPDTAHFGTPMAHLQGSCDFGEHFSAQKLIFNTDFCGDWAGGIFGQDGLCPMSDPSDTFKSCKTYVAENPEKYKDSYWEINSVQIYMAGSRHHESSQPASAGTASGTEVPTSSAAPAVESTAEATTSSIASTTAAPEPTSESTPVAESTVSSESSTPPTTQSPVESVPAPDTSAPIQPTSGTTSAVPETTQLPAETTSSAVHAKQSKSRSTVYATSTTTICPQAASSTAVGAVGANEPEPETSQASHSFPASNNVQEHGSQSPASEAPATSTPVAEPVAESTEAPAELRPTGADAVGASAPASSESSAAPVTQASSTETPTQAPATHDPQASEPAPSSAAAVENSAAPSPAPATSRVPVISSERAYSPSSSTPSTVHASGSSYYPGYGASGTPSGSGPTPPLFTGAASRLSVGVTGVLGAVAVALMV